MANWANVSNNVSEKAEQNGLTAGKILVCVVLYIIVLITIIGNVLVLVAIKTDKRLQTLSNYYIINLAVNLAITDIVVGITCMSFYTLDVTLGYWPFGEVMCAVWVFCDYGMTFASVFTLIAISLDRFWSVTWSLHYRTHHTRKKCLLIIAVIWVTMMVLWLPACIADRIQSPAPGTCRWEPSLNKEYVVVIAIIGHHGSFLILIVCYVRVLLFIRKRQVNPVVSRRKALSTNLPAPGDNYSFVPSTSGLLAGQFVPGSCDMTSHRLQPLQFLSTQESNRSCKMIANPRTVVTDSTSSNNKEKKVFVTLTYILVGYVICWLPFHIVFDVSALAPEKVPSVAYTVTFWLAYCNSTLNPVLYNFSSNDFRDAFGKILRGRCRASEERCTASING